MKPFFFVSFLCIVAGFSSGLAAEKPNFVWLISEDNSKHYLKLFDPSGAPAPNIEALAGHGLTFTRAFSNSPVCSVARTTLATSCYGPRIGPQFHRRSQLAAMPPGLKMFPAYLNEAGYDTTNNSKKDYNAIEGPNVWSESSKKATWRNRSTKDQPFFHMQSFGQSHESSLHFKASEREKQTNATDASTLKLADYHPDTSLTRYTYARYHDRMGVIDDSIGKVVDQLKKDGLLEDTFVFYFGDHGGVLPRSKGYIYESGLHVPLVVRIPENFKHLVDAKPGSQIDGFVSFIDFGPTLLNLAGLPVPKQVDGIPFLGEGIKMSEVNQRDSTIGYADRFDEKYDLCRSLRKGNFKYIRNYQAYYPDGLQNNYRYKMLAYEEWRSLSLSGELNEAQNQFFQPKQVEALYDIENDPHEVHNLAADPAHRQTLVELRAQLQETIKGWPDLSFYPENVLVDEAFAQPVAFGREHQAEIATFIDTIDLSLIPFAEAKPKLASALKHESPWVRYWAATAASCFGEDASSLTPDVETLLQDAEPLVRVRAAEFLGIIGATDPRPTFREVLSETEHPWEALITLNSVVFFHDRFPDPLPFDMDAVTMKTTKGEVQRRTEYLSGKLR